MKPAVAEPRSAPRASYTTSTDSTGSAPARTAACGRPQRTAGGERSEPPLSVRRDLLPAARPVNARRGLHVRRRAASAARAPDRLIIAGFSLGLFRAHPAALVADAPVRLVGEDVLPLRAG